MGGNTINNHVSLTCMTMIYPAMGWFEIVKVSTFELDKVTDVNDEYIYKPYSRVSQLSNSSWIIIYSRPHKVLFDNGSNFKQYFTNLI